jgi:exodeoxyribonuclease VII large subunit
VKDTTLPLDFTIRPAVPESQKPASSQQSPAPLPAPAPAPLPTPAPARAPTPTPPPVPPPRALSVAELDRAIRQTLDVSFDRAVWVEGEVTNARAPTSGHAYFCLKDEREDASIDCVIYKTNLTPRMRALLQDGARARLRGRPTFWAPRGRLQLVADRIALAGRGAMLEALEKLKAKLAAEGLFALERKRPLPREARTVGVVTSETGAAIHDICKVAFRRGGAHVLLAPAQVQGTGAALSVARALVWLQRVPEVDVIIVGRGGGASDDLAAFNDEALVRTVAACRVPVISAVGHEIDVTLVDFVADARAATPSQAAEMAVPDARARRVALMHTRQRLERGMVARLAEGRRRFDQASRRLGDPRLAIASFQQSLDDRRARLERTWTKTAEEARTKSTQLSRRLAALHPIARLAGERAQITLLSSRLAVTMRRRVGTRDKDIHRLAGRLDAMSPLKVLARGYAIATREDGRAVRDPGDVAPGDVLALRVRSARILAHVTSVEDQGPVDAWGPSPRDDIGPKGDVGGKR